MKVLVVGSGGREHALVWKLKQSPRVKELYCAPGNAGIADLAACVDIPANDIKKLAEFALREGMDLTVVGPEVPLTMGITDYFTEQGLSVFGPTRAAAILEASKAFTKELLEKYRIPTGDYKVFKKRDEAMDYLDQAKLPLVVKADGLAAGKGVIVAQSLPDARKAVDLIMGERAFGAAGEQVVIEEFLTGEEASFLAFVDGGTVLPLPSSQDHKAIYDGDRGPNTGGMGAYSPAPVVTGELSRQVMEEIMLPLVNAMRAEGRPYKGVLYAGLMIENGKAKVLEFNCRFGDPEAQPLLMRLKTDLVDIMTAVIEGRLADIRLEIDPRPAVCVVMASKGYPGSYEKDKAISGLPAAGKRQDVEVFHAGTVRRDDKILTAGGRVLGVTALGGSLDKAVRAAYETVEDISWEGCYFRRDIAGKALNRQKGEPPPLVGIVVGSDSDLPVIRPALDFLKQMHIEYEVTVASAHRTPDLTRTYAKSAKDRGLKVIIAGAGMAAHLAGVLAAYCPLPVIGVPIDASPLNGLDSLLSTVQMPPGVPVASMGIGAPGAKNAVIMAARILSLLDDDLADRLEKFRRSMTEEAEKKAHSVRFVT